MNTCAYVCVLLKVSMFVKMLSLVHTYMRIFAHVVGRIFIYIHIYSAVCGWGKGETKEKNMRRDKWVIRGGNQSVTIGMISFSLDPTFVYIVS